MRTQQIRPELSCGVGVVDFSFAYLSNNSRKLVELKLLQLDDLEYQVIVYYKWKSLAGHFFEVQSFDLFLKTNVVLLLLFVVFEQCLERADAKGDTTLNLFFKFFSTSESSSWNFLDFSNQIITRSNRVQHCFDVLLLAFNEVK